MENRERDRVSQRSTPTEAGELNRRTEEERGRRENSGTAEFGQNIGRSENLNEGGEMNRNRNQDEVSSNRENMENEGGRRSGLGDLGSSSTNRRPGSKQSDSSGVTNDRSSSGGRGSSGSSGIGDSSQGRH